MAGEHLSIWDRLQECVGILSEPFRASEIIGWFRRHYPAVNETSLRTHIQLATSNVTDRGAFASRPPLITRVERGVYVRAANTEGPRAGRAHQPASVHGYGTAERERPPTVTDEASVQPDWHTEANVVGLVVRHLAVAGWSVRAVADTASRAPGVDVVTVRGEESIGIEVKGYPGRNYADPRRAGEKKRTHPATQAPLWFASAVVSGMKLRTKEPRMRSVLAFPSFQAYRGLYADTATSLVACGIEVWWVHEDGSVSEAQLSQ